MTSRTLRRRLHHGDVDGKKQEHMEASSGLDGLDEPLLGYYEHDDRHSEGDTNEDLWEEERRKEHLHWTRLFSQLIAQWAQWFANIVLGSGSLIGRLLPFSSYTQRGQSNKLLPLSLSPLQEERLQNLRQRLEVPFDGSRVEHQDALKQLWRLAYPERELPSLKSELWKEMGWQGSDPSTDFRGGGFISLENLIFFAQRYPGWPSLSSHIHYEVGDGTLIKFLQDRWCGQTSLAVCYPELFRLSCNKDASVADFMHFTNVVLHWDLHFVRAIQDWELESLMTFMCAIYDSEIRGIGKDKICGAFGGKGIAKVLKIPSILCLRSVKADLGITLFGINLEFIPKLVILEAWWSMVYPSFSYLSEHLLESFQRLLHKQDGTRAEWEYPFAVAGINISFMLAQMLDLQSGKPTSLAGIRFLELLGEDEMAFDNLYCVAFRMMDAQWLAKRASYMEFNDVLKSTRTQLERELALEDVINVRDLPAYNLLKR
uniref:ELMO domain-containing protein n=1 Tax=Quercus lobata TaxID=97700 RepID=A0A7N2M3X4_QUELO